MSFLYFLYNQTHQNKINNVFLVFYFILFLLLSLFYSFLFFPVINLQQRTQPQTQISTKRQTHISSIAISPAKQTLAFKPINFLGKQKQKNPQEKQTKMPQITTTESKNMNIKSKKKNRNPTSSKVPPSNQIFQNFPATSKALTSNLQKSSAKNFQINLKERKRETMR